MEGISTGEASRALDVTTQTVRNLVRDGLLDGVQGEDGRFLVCPESIESYKQDIGQKHVGAKTKHSKQKPFAKKFGSWGQSAGAVFSQMVFDEYGARPDLDVIYDYAVNRARPIDEFDLETWIIAPGGVSQMIDTTPVFLLPLWGHEHLDGICHGFRLYDNYSVQEAEDYYHNQARWWWAIRSGGKVVARSEDAKNIPGVYAWLDRLRAKEQRAYEESTRFDFVNASHRLHELANYLANLKRMLPPPPPSRMAMAAEFLQLINESEKSDGSGGENGGV